MSDSRVLAQALTWMKKRDWRAKLAKSKSGQSLLEHSLIELDVFLQLAPILRDAKHYGLSDLEEAILMVSLLVHDAGKETDAWQAYVSSSGTGPWVSHVSPELTEKLVPEICAAFGLDGISSEIQRVMIHCAGIHHDRPGRSDTAILEAVLSGASDRFVTLANLVKAIDRLCSAGSPSDAARAAMGDAGLQKHLRMTTHELIPRGVSTTVLHRVAQQAFELAGWKPLLFFATGTVYVADLNAICPIPSTGDILGLLTTDLENALNRDMTQLMVGSPTGNLLPKPDLLSFSESRSYLAKAGQKIGAQSFAKKRFQDKQRVVQEYLKLKGGTGTPDAGQVEQHAGRISVAQPEMLVFKFFKAMMDPDRVPAVGADGAKLAQEHYEAVFGAGSWDELQSTSTLMAARDMANTVDRYWELPGSSVGYSVPRVEEIPPQTRLELLIGILDRIASQVFESVNRPSPRSALAASMAKGFVADLLVPNEGGDVKALASKQLNHYRHSKPFAGKELAAAVYLCPICSNPFDLERGLKASADFIDNPQTHTNRGRSHGGFGYVMVCSTCYHERLIRQILLGQPLAEIIVLAPRLNLGPINGAQLLQRIREWTDAANGAIGAESGFSLGFTDHAARRAHNHDPFEMAPGDLVALFRYRVSSDTQKKRKHEVLQLLKEAFDDSLDALNTACVRSFPSWEAALEALVADQIDQQDCKAIRRKVFRLGAIELIPQTPNMILIPLSAPIAAGKDESESSKALRRLYVSLILSVVFDASVAIRRAADIGELGQSAGAAYVPPVPAVRSLIGREWVKASEARYWLTAIGAASILARDASLPPRSALYQALASDPAERLVRRIEAGGRSISPLQLSLISQLPGFHAGRLQEVHT